MEAHPLPLPCFSTPPLWHKEDHVYYYQFLRLCDRHSSVHMVLQRKDRDERACAFISLVERRTPFITITLTAQFHQSTWFSAQVLKKRVCITTIIFSIITHVRNLRKNVECRNSLCGRSSFGGIVPYFWVGSCDLRIIVPGTMVHPKTL